MKRIILIMLMLYVHTLSAQQTEITNHHISSYFKEIEKATKRNIKLWDKQLYQNILLVDPKTRQVYSNTPDSANILTLQHGIYSGKLPENINIANTALSWSGKRWAMIMLPLSNHKYDRINLLAHELFHTLQPELGFQQYNKESNHLDQKDGRIYLRLELEALKKAILSKSEKARQIHLAKAILFRKYRNSLFPNSDTLENQLELNEGLAEFTGLIISGRNHKETTAHFRNEIDSFFKNPTYVRSFAYYTTPVYGYLLYKKNKYWNKEIRPDANLTDFFIQQLNIAVPQDLKANSLKSADEYHGQLIFKEEILREERIKKQIYEYKVKFIEQPHFEIHLKKMNISFDPRNILPIEEKGTVYPKMRVTDVWGILEVEMGALMSSNWNKISITNPTKISPNKVEGDGWILTLKDGYVVKKEEKTGNYIISKTE
ncbi:hypothetical protein [Pedobacter chitinilyticus]|uniref:Uncharacterized protein n=1 Tax=Pedobacter chitinilyticus TaxID=2233776 RepID=A0A443YJE8_9SPHI|nr:hypothetical protein [Pedobacter chitinilyticus]RWU03858.1 hypothetical protein DPV69_19415 [Pedobacter chitinilyticus]